jgi:hypothetical protein
VYNWRHFRFLLDNGPFHIHEILTKALDIEAENAVSNMQMMVSNSTIWGTAVPVYPYSRETCL